MGKSAFLMLATVILLVAGCGSSGDETTVASIPKARYLKLAGDICDKAENKKYAQIGAAYKLARGGGKNFEPNEEVLEELTSTVVVPVLTEMAEDLRALPPPAAGEDKADQAIDQLEKDLKRTKADPGLFVNSEAFNATNVAVKAAGMDRCYVNQ